MNGELRTWFVTWEVREVRGIHVDAETWEDALAQVKASDEDGKWIETLDDGAYAVADDSGAIVYGVEVDGQIP